MNTAGGPVQGEEAWPLPPIALPRGLREHAWHAALLLSLLLLGLLPPLRVPIVTITIVVILAQGLTGVVVPPWMLRRLAMLAIVIAASVGRIQLEAAGVRSLLIGMMLRREDLGLLAQADRVAVEAWLWAVGLLIVATIAGFDLRVVNRQVADERVWARQQARRRQVMAQHHRKNPPPETL